MVTVNTATKGFRIPIEKLLTFTYRDDTENTPFHTGESSLFRVRKDRQGRSVFIPNPSIDRTHDPSTGSLVFGNSERPANPIDAAEIPTVKDDDVAIGQRARATERSEKNSAQARHNGVQRGADAETTEKEW